LNGIGVGVVAFVQDILQFLRSELANAGEGEGVVDAVEDEKLGMLRVALDVVGVLLSQEESISFRSADPLRAD
jgi:hypothetical protein